MINRLINKSLKSYKVRDDFLKCEKTVLDSPVRWARSLMFF